MAILDRSRRSPISELVKDDIGLIIFLDQELIFYHYSFKVILLLLLFFFVLLVGATVFKKPKSSSFQIGSGWNLAGSFL